MNKEGVPKTPVEAVALGLHLGITAPTEEKAKMAADLAEEIAYKASLSESDIRRAKEMALEMSKIRSEAWQHHKKI